MAGFFENLGRPLIQALASRLGGDQCRTVNLRRHAQHELARSGLLRTNTPLFAVAQEVFDGRLKLGTQLSDCLPVKTYHGV